MDLRAAEPGSDGGHRKIYEFEDADSERMKKSQLMTQWTRQLSNKQVTEDTQTQESSCTWEEKSPSPQLSRDADRDLDTAASSGQHTIQKWEVADREWTEGRQSQATTIVGRASDFFQSSTADRLIIEESAGEGSAGSSVAFGQDNTALKREQNGFSDDASQEQIEASDHVSRQQLNGELVSSEQDQYEAWESSRRGISEAWIAHRREKEGLGASRQLVEGEMCSLGTACAICGSPAALGAVSGSAAAIEASGSSEAGQGSGHKGKAAAVVLEPIVEDTSRGNDHNPFADDAEEFCSNSSHRRKSSAFTDQFAALAAEDAISRAYWGSGGGGGGSGGVGGGLGWGDFYGGDSGKGEGRVIFSEGEEEDIQARNIGSRGETENMEKSAWSSTRRQDKFASFSGRWKEDSRMIIRQVMREKSFSDIANALGIISIILAGFAFAGALVTLTCQTNYVSELLAWAAVMFMAAFLATLPLQVAATTLKGQHGELYCAAEQHYDAGITWFCRVQFFIIGLFELAGLILIMLVILNLGHLRPFIAGILILVFIPLTILIPLEMQRRYLHAHRPRRTLWQSIKYKIRHNWKGRLGVVLQIILYVGLIVLLAVLTAIPYNPVTWPSNQCTPPSPCCKSPNVTPGLDTNGTVVTNGSTIYISTVHVNTGRRTTVTITETPPTPAPPTSTPPTSSPPTSTPPTPGPPTTSPPTSKPPTSTPPTSTPPTTSPPTSTPPTSSPPTSTPSTSTPPTSTPPTSSPSTSTSPTPSPPTSTQPTSTPPTSTPPTSTSPTPSPSTSTPPTSIPPTPIPPSSCPSCPAWPPYPPYPPYPAWPPYPPYPLGPNTWGSTVIVVTCLGQSVSTGHIGFSTKTITETMCLPTTTPPRLTSSSPSASVPTTSTGPGSSPPTRPPSPPTPPTSPPSSTLPPSSSPTPPTSPSPNTLPPSSSPTPPISPSSNTLTPSSYPIPSISSPSNSLPTPSPPQSKGGSHSAPWESTRPPPPPYPESSYHVSSPPPPTTTTKSCTDDEYPTSSLNTATPLTVPSYADTTPTPAPSKYDETTTVTY